MSLRICFQTLIKLKHIQKLEILYEIDVRLHTKVRSPICHVLLAVQNTRSYSSTTKNLLDFSQTKLSVIYGHKPTVLWHLFGLNAAISKHIQLDFFCAMEKLLIFFICEI